MVPRRLCALFCLEPVVLLRERDWMVSGGGIGADERRCCYSFPRGEVAPYLCASDTLRARTVPPSLRWNQLMIGLLARRETFFIWSWVCDLVVVAELGAGMGGELGALEASFLVLTVDVRAAACCGGEPDAFARGRVAALAIEVGTELGC